MFVWLSKRSCDGLVNDDRFNKLLKGLGDFGGSVSDWVCIWLLGISHVSSLKEIVGDFSLINPYGVRVKGFLCVCLGLRVARSIGSGLRVFPE